MSRFSEWRSMKSRNLYQWTINHRVSSFGYLQISVTHSLLTYASTQEQGSTISCQHSALASAIYYRAHWDISQTRYPLLNLAAKSTPHTRGMKGDWILLLISKLYIILRDDKLCLKSRIWVRLSITSTAVTPIMNLDLRLENSLYSLMYVTSFWHIYKKFN